MILSPVASGKFVGRTAEQAFLLKRFEVTCAQQLSIVILEGDAGIGKTRLIEEFRAALPRAAGFGVGYCLEYVRAPYLPFNDVFAQLGLQTPTTPAESGHGISTEDKLLHFSAIATALQKYAARRPLAIVIEDIQWADDASIELIHHLGHVSSATSYPRSPGNFEMLHFGEIHDIVPPSITTQMQTAYSTHPEGGDYIGLAAGSDGMFHPLWTDSRSGTYQLYTASITVPLLPRARVARRQKLSEQVAGPINVSNYVDLLIGGSRYDVSTGDFLIPIRIKNVSKKTIHRPLTVSLISQIPGSKAIGLRANSILVRNAITTDRALGYTVEYSQAIPTKGLIPGGISNQIVWRIHLQMTNAPASVTFVIRSPSGP